MGLPLEFVPKKDPGEYKLIHYLYPRSSLINDATPSNSASFDHVVGLVRSFSQGVLMVKCDV